MISAQNFIIVLAIFWYDNKIARHEKMLFLGVFGLFATVLLADEAMHEMHWCIVSSSVMICSALARGSQFFENRRNNSTGQVAGATVSITFFIAFSRTMVVLSESDDFMYQLQYLFGLFMVSAIAIQFVYMNYLRKSAKKAPRQRSSRSSGSTKGDRRRSPSPTSRSRSRSPRKR